MTTSLVLSLATTALALRVTEDDHPLAGTPSRVVGCALKAYAVCGKHAVAGEPELEKMFKRITSNEALREFMPSCPEPDCSTIGAELLQNEEFASIVADAHWMPGQVIEELQTEKEAQEATDEDFPIEEFREGDIEEVAYDDYDGSWADHMEEPVKVEEAVTYEDYDMN